MKAGSCKCGGKHAWLVAARTDLFNLAVISLYRFYLPDLRDAIPDIELIRL